MKPPLVSYIIHCDRPCRHCGDVHGYVTKHCIIVVYARRSTAEAVCLRHKIPLVNIEAHLGIPPEVGAYVLDITDHTRHDATDHRNAALSRRRS